MYPITHETWPALPYKDFEPTIYFLHRLVQMIGKLKLTTPFEPHWANVALWPTTRGLTTGVIPYKNGIFSVSIDFTEHTVHFDSSWGKKSELPLKPSSIAMLFTNFLKCLDEINVNIKLNPLPPEIPNAISFTEDNKARTYDHVLVRNWWQIVISSYKILEIYHTRFAGISPAVGFMWGTFDLRDARYRNVPVDVSKLGFIDRNAMDVQQVEVGWWPGNEKYEKPAFFSFTYPQPPGIENEKIKPETAVWDKNMGEFMLDYDLLRNSADPDNMVLSFFESTYEVGSRLAGWEANLITSGKAK